MHVEPICFQVVWERLLDVEDHPEDSGRLDHEAIEHVVHITGLGHCAVEIGAEPLDAFFDRDLANTKQALVIPGSVISAQFDLEAFQTISANPIAKQIWVAVGRRGFILIGGLDPVLSTNQMPRRKRFATGVTR